MQLSAAAILLALGLAAFAAGAEAVSGELAREAVTRWRWAHGLVPAAAGTP